MADKNNKPVIFLAFANDRDDTVAYLRSLPDEARRLRDVLDAAAQDGLCEVVVRSNSTAADIFKVFQDPKYRNRVAVFHFGGHANGYQLLLESAGGAAATADAGGLAAFMAAQQGLQLVFLNGCSTQQQTQGLLDANVPAVISTSRSIEDQVAMDFAHQFYQGLAGGASIRTAFCEAEAAVQTARGGNTRDFYFDDEESSHKQLEADRWPWDLYLRPGSERADQWNLPDAVNDPMFGLPPLPKQDLPEHPYRHLKWFTHEDAEVFFGRGHQVRELYDRLTATGSAPITLFYGQSGVGKSSLLAAGLFPRLLQDYDVRYLRRGADGLLATLRSGFPPEMSDVSIDVAWRQREQQTGKPLIIFLDQVEELYTRPIPDLPNELEQLLNALEPTFGDVERRPQGKLVLSFRKEWLAELEDRLIAHGLPRSRVFLEPLDRRGILEVVFGPAKSARLKEHYELEVDDGLAGIIADDLLEDRDSAIAPTLQVLLTKMWNKANDENYEHPRFSQELYQHLKRDGILLRDFLNQQIDAFRARYPEAVDSGLLLDIVALHTTPLGTASQRDMEELRQQYEHRGAELPDLLQECQDLHLLTVATDSQKNGIKRTRLAHDTLAPLVRERFEESDMPGQRARRILDNRSVDWAGDQVGAPLDEADLALVEQGASGTRTLSATEQRLLNASRQLRAKLQRTRKAVKIAGAAAILAIVVTAAIAVLKWQQAERQERMAISQYLAAQSLAIQEESPVKSLLLAIESVETTHRRDEPIATFAHQRLRDAIASVGGRPLPGHDSPIRAVTTSPDGRWLVTGSGGGGARRWDLASDDPGVSGEVVARHKKQIRALVISPDGRWLVTASWDGTASVWDLNADKPVEHMVMLKGHTLAINTATISSDGRWLLTGSEDRTARLWDLRFRDPSKHVVVLEGFAGPVRTVAISHGGRWLAVGSDDRTVRLWRLTSAGPAGSAVVLDGHTGVVYTVAISHDERWLVTGSKDKRGDNTARLWDLTADNVPASMVLLEGHGATVTDVANSKNGRWLLTGGSDKVARLWDLRSENPAACVLVLSGHEERINAVAIDPGGQWLITGSRDKTVRLWHMKSATKALSDARRMAADPASSADASECRASATSEVVLSGHERPIDAVAISSDGRWLATASDENAARLWDLLSPESSTSTAVLPGRKRGINAFALGPDGRWLAAGGVDNAIRLWDLESDAPMVELIEHDRPVRALAISPEDGRWLVTGSDDRSARLWDLADLTVPAEELSGHGEGVTAVAISRNAHSVVTASDKENSALLWRLTSAGLARPAVELEGHTEPIKTVAISPDGARLATAGFDNTVRLWDLTADDPANRSIVLCGHEGLVAAVTFSPDGRWLAAGGAGIGARLWDLADVESGAAADQESCAGGVSYRDLQETTEVINTVTFSPNGRWLVMGSLAGAAWLWDLTNPAQSAFELSRHTNGISALAVGPNNRWLVTASFDKTARLWDLSSTIHAASWVELRGHGAAVSDVAISPDGNTLITGSHDGTARLWDLRIDKLLDDARAVAGRELTDEERENFLLD